MRLSTKGRYGVTAMMDLAIHDNAGPVTLADISQCQGISLSYLEQLFAKLRKSGLVEGIRGPGGGYRLSRPADQITTTWSTYTFNQPTFTQFCEQLFKISKEDIPGHCRNISQSNWTRIIMYCQIHHCSDAVTAFGRQVSLAAS